MKRIWIVLLLFCAVACGQNDFPSDPSFKALWNYDDGALATDSIGSNDWTTITGDVSADTGQKKQGDASVRFTTVASAIEQADIELDAGFPFSNGESGTGFIGLWVRFNSLPGEGVAAELFYKQATFNTTIVIGTRTVSGDTKFEMSTQNGVGRDTDRHGSALAVDTWYHVGVNMTNEGSLPFLIRVHDESGTLGSDVTGTKVGALNMAASILHIGRNSVNGDKLDGWLDEIIVGDRILTTDEIDQIWAGTFGSNANDFSCDPNCQAVYRGEDGAVTVDSKNSNTLTTSTVSANTSIFVEGAASLDCTAVGSTQFLTLTDAAMGAGFPGKSGSAIGDFSICYRAYFTVLPVSGGFDAIVSKWYSGGNKRSYFLGLRQNGGIVEFVFFNGHTSGTATEIIAHGTNIVTDRWYDVGFTYVESTKAWKLRIRDRTTGLLLGGAEVTGTASNAMSVTTQHFQIDNTQDSTNNTQANIDEVVLWNREISSAEIDAYSAQTFDSCAGGAAQIIQAKWFDWEIKTLLRDGINGKWTFEYAA